MSEKELMVDFSDMTDKELLDFKPILEEKYQKLCDDRASELAALSQDENFDPYSFGGSHKINQIVKKYQELDDGFSYLYEELLKELEQRRISLSDVELQSNKGIDQNLSDEELFEYFTEEDIYTYENWGEGYEHDSDSFTTPGGERVVVDCYYGYDY